MLLTRPTRKPSSGPTSEPSAPKNDGGLLSRSTDRPVQRRPVQGSVTWLKAREDWLRRMDADALTFSETALRIRLQELEAVIERREREHFCPPPGLSDADLLEREYRLARLEGQKCAVETKLRDWSSFAPGRTRSITTAGSEPGLSLSWDPDPFLEE